MPVKLNSDVRAPALEKLRIQILFQQNGITQLSSLAIAIIYYFSYRGVVPQARLNVWATFFTVLLIGRILGSLSFTRYFIDGRRDFDAALYERFFAFGVLLSGLTWAAAASVNLPSHSIAHDAVMGFIISGLTAGASLAYCTSPLSAQVFLFSTTLPFLIKLISESTMIHYAMAAMSICYLLIYSLLTRQINGYAYNSIKLRFEKDELLNEAQNNVREIAENKKTMSEALGLAQEVQRLAHVGSFVIYADSSRMNWSDEVFRIFEMEPQTGTASLELYFQLLHPDDRPEAKRCIELAMTEGVLAEYDGRFITPKGNLKYIAVKAVPQRGADQKVKSVNYVLHDVTARKKSEIALAQSFKMSALGEMASGMAHEINSPLAIVAMRAEQLKDFLNSESFDRARAIEWAEKIEATTQRISKIIKGLQAFSKQSESTTFDLVDVKTVIDDTIALCHEKFLSQHVALTCNTEGEMVIECRAIQISQVIFSLLSNSFDAVIGHSEKWVTVSARNNLENIEIAVTDSGGPIAEDIRAKMMQPFFTTKEIGKGTGLGLSISKGIIEAHSGTLSYDLHNAHTSFVITLPKVQSRQLTA